MNRQVLLIGGLPRYRQSDKLAFAKLADFTIFEAASVQEGIEVLKVNRDIQVILLDLSLGESRGTELLEVIKDKADQYRVIIATAQEMFLSAKEASQYDVFAYQAKTTGFSVESLFFKVEQAFKDIEREQLKIKAQALIQERDKLRTQINAQRSKIEALRQERRQLSTEVELTDEANEVLSAIARRTGRSRAEIIQETVCRYIAAFDKKLSEESVESTFEVEDVLDQTFGIWAARDDLPDFEALRQEADKRLSRLWHA